MKKLLCLLISVLTLLAALPAGANAVIPDTKCTDIGAGFARLESYGGSDASLTINAAGDTPVISEICAEAFTYIDTLSSISIGSGLEVIGSSAFEGCSELSRVELPDTLIYIGNYAFTGCESLNAVTIPESVTKIGSNAFSDVGSSFVASVYSGSADEAYCEENGINYTLADRGCTHDYSLSVPTLLPTCTSEGKSRAKCSICGNLGDDINTIPAKGHSFGKTENRGGSRVRTCENCGIAINSFIEQSGCADSPYRDVSEGSWYAEAACYCYRNKLMCGTDTDSFSPGLTLNRAMLVTMLGSLDGADTSAYTQSGFPDVPDGKWYTPYVGWAKQYGIADGDGENFAPGETVTREQLYTMLLAYSAYRGFGTGFTADALERFPDAGDTHEWARNAMCWAADNGLCAGDDHGMLTPRAGLTRAQAAVALRAFTTEFCKPAAGDYDRVVVIGVDGGGAFWADTDTPNADRIFKTYTYTAQSEYPTHTAQNWTSMLRGVGPDVHGISDTNIGLRVFDSRVSIPSMLRVVRENMPGEKVAAFCAWSSIYRAGSESNIGANFYSGGGDAALTSRLCSYLDANDPKLLFTMLGECDSAGHYGGFGSEPFLEKLRAADELVGEIYDKYVELGRAERTLFILTNDHGGTLQGSHGGILPSEINVFMGFSEYTVRPGELADGIRNRDVAAIALDALGLPIPEIYSAKVPEDLFE